MARTAPAAGSGLPQPSFVEGYLRVLPSNPRVGFVRVEGFADAIVGKTATHERASTGASTGASAGAGAGERGARGGRVHDRDQQQQQQQHGRGRHGAAAAADMEGTWPALHGDWVRAEVLRWEPRRDTHSWGQAEAIEPETAELVRRLWRPSEAVTARIQATFGEEEEIEGDQPIARIVSKDDSRSLRRPDVLGVFDAEQLQQHLQGHDGGHRQQRGRGAGGGGGGGEFVLLHPVFPSLPYLRASLAEVRQLAERLTEAGSDDLAQFFVRGTILPDWPRGQKSPSVGDLQLVGRGGHIPSETVALLDTYGLLSGHAARPSAEFPTTLLEDLLPYYGSAPPVALPTQEGARRLLVGSSRNSWRIPDDELARRVDFRESRCVFTCDPTSAKDLDDALHAVELPDGTIEVGVHIADVSYFVKPNSLLDREACRRATTIYLVHQVMPMLPPLLSEELCSLNPDKDRLAFSVVWRMNRDGTRVEGDRARFMRSVIRSCAKLDYASAQNMVSGVVPADCGAEAAGVPAEAWPVARRPRAGGSFTCEDVVRSVRLLEGIAAGRRPKRLEAGSLVLMRTKLSFQLDPDTQLPRGFSQYPIHASNRMVEEFMLLANFLVAERLLEAFPTTAFLRNHPDPSKKGLDKVERLARCAQVHVDVSSPWGLQRSLAQISLQFQDSDPLLLQAITALMSTPMHEASYLAAGEVLPHHLRHFALAIPYYTHFTSPIRRYPDVMVHRMLACALCQESGTADLASFLPNGEGMPWLRGNDMLRIGDMGKSSLEGLDGVVQRIAWWCNTMKTRSRLVQARCDEVYLALYLRENPVVADAVVIDLGKGSFTACIPSLGTDLRMDLRDMSDTVEHWDADSEDDVSYISLRLKNGTTVTLQPLQRVRIDCRCSLSLPVAVQGRLVFDA